MENKINIFEFIVHELKKWYSEKNEINSLLEFNAKNDFSILKLIKLHFLVVTINSGKEGILLDEFSFFAMPYGPVETDIYTRIKTNPDFTSFTVNNFKSVFRDENYLGEVIEKGIMDSIEKSIQRLKEVDDNLINADAGSLVELTHKWNSWRITYSEARKLGKYSLPISSELIKKDNKYLSLEVF